MKKKIKHPKSNLKKSPQNRVSSGIKKFDEMSSGGFEQNSTNLIVGGVGSGKSIFGTQFLVEGIKNKEPCLYISFEENKKNFYSNMLKLEWDLERMEKDGKFFFIEYTPEKVRTMLEEGGGIIESVVLREKIKRIVIDSVNSFELLFEDEIKKRESALSLLSLLKKWDCTTLLIYGVETSSNKKENSFNVLGFESDSIVLLHFIRKKEKRERSLEILKMRGCEHSTRIHTFQIKNKGIS